MRKLLNGLLVYYGYQEAETLIVNARAEFFPCVIEIDLEMEG